MNGARRLLVASLALLSCLSSACQFDLWVFDGPDQHEDPKGKGTLITDGACRSLGVPGTSAAALFPGFYRATCDGGTITFAASGCDDATCERCERDPFKPSALYMTLPLNTHTPPEETVNGAHSVDLIVSYEGVTIYFAAYGACGTCPVAPRPTSAPTTRQPSLRPTTKVETFTISPTLSPIVSRSQAAAPFTFAPVDRPTSPDTEAPTVVEEEPEERPTNNVNTLTTPVPIVSVGITTPPVAESTTDVTSTTSPTAVKKTSSAASSVVYGSTIGSVVVLLALGLSLFAYRRRNEKRAAKASVARRTTIHVDDKATDSENSRDVIVLLNKDSAEEDMSTLGGYTATNKNAMSARDEQQSVFEDPTASVDIPFDYERNEYKATGRSTVGASTTTDFSNASVLQRLGGLLLQADDENSFEQQFQESSIPQRGRRRRHWTSLEVQVPPGMVGMVVDNADIPNEPPLVRALRPDSVLAQKVKIGDRLLSVNGRDVTQVPATQVSRMIAANQSQQTRTLVFARLVVEDGAE